MKVVTIQGTKREELGSKTAKDLRREGNVPCVIYGGKENVHFYTPDSNFKELLYTAEAHIVHIEVDGQTYKAVIRDAQFHPVSDAIEHVDFFELVEGKPVVIEVPINLVGNARGVRNGGRLKVNLRKVKVKALEENLPSSIDINIENLRIGQAVRIQDVEAGNFEIIQDPLRTVAVIQTSRNVVEDSDDEEEEGGEEAAAEGGEETTAAAEA